jgi:DNA-binding response OmpR family regulator
MPGVSGLDVVRYMRRLEQTQHIPVILVTGFGPDAELTATAFRLGVADLVMKPIDPWALRTKVRYLYDSHQRHRPWNRKSANSAPWSRNNRPPHATWDRPASPSKPRDGPKGHTPGAQPEGTNPDQVRPCALPAHQAAWHPCPY